MATLITLTRITNYKQYLGECHRKRVTSTNSISIVCHSKSDMKLRAKQTDQSNCIAEKWNLQQCNHLLPPGVLALGDFPTGSLIQDHTGEYLSKKEEDLSVKFIKCA